MGRRRGVRTGGGVGELRGRPCGQEDLRVGQNSQIIFRRRASFVASWRLRGHLNKLPILSHLTVGPTV